MLDTKNVIGALPLVADALGRRYGVKVHIGGERAYTDGKDIHIPGIPLDADMDTLNLVRGYLDHESAHLRLTNFEVLKEANLVPIEKHVWNIIEDFMVERQLAAIYPGCEHNFNWLIKHIFLSENGKDSDIEDSAATVIFNWLLVSLRALYVPDLKQRQAILAKALEDKYPGLISVLEPLVLAIPNQCNDTQSCISMAKRIIACIRSYDENQLQREQNQDGDTGSAENSVQDNENNRSPENAEKPEDCGNASETDTDDADAQSMKVPNGAEDNAQSNCGANSQTACKDQLGEEIQTAIEQPEIGGQQTSIADEEAKCPGTEHGLEKNHHPTLQEILDDPSCLKSQDIGELAGKLLENANHEGSTHQLEVATEFPVQYGTFTQSEIADIRQQTNALRTRLTGMLQAKVLSRNHIGRIGRVDPRRMARLAVNDPKIFARQKQKQGVNTAVHILLDASGSMSGEKMKLASRVCYAVADALWQIPGVGVAVTSFPACEVWDAEECRLIWATVGAVLKHKNRLHTKFAIRCDGGTPMAEALWWVLQQMKPLSEERKIILILSDGYPDDIETTKEALKAISLNGFEVYGIGIETSAMSGLLPENRSRSIYNLYELAQAVFELLRPALLKTKGGSHAAY